MEAHGNQGHVANRCVGVPRSSRAQGAQRGGTCISHLLLWASQNYSESRLCWARFQALGTWGNDPCARGADSLKVTRDNTCNVLSGGQKHDREKPSRGKGWGLLGRGICSVSGAVRESLPREVSFEQRGGGSGEGASCGAMQGNSPCESRGA